MQIRLNGGTLRIAACRGSLENHGATLQIVDSPLESTPTIGKLSLEGSYTQNRGTLVLDMDAREPQTRFDQLHASRVSFSDDGKGIRLNVIGPYNQLSRNTLPVIQTSEPIQFSPDYPRCPESPDCVLLTTHANGTAYYWTLSTNGDLQYLGTRTPARLPSDWILLLAATLAGIAMLLPKVTKQRSS